MRINENSRLFGCMVLALLVAVAAAAQSVPAGSQLQVRVIENLDSGKTKTGDVFHGTLAQAVVANGRTVFPKGADVTGRVMNAHSSGRLSDPGVLELALTSIRVGSREYPVNAEPFLIKGESHTKSNVTKIGGGAAAGAVIGAIAGGGKGAAIGAGVGAAAGTGVAAATGKKDAKVESEAVLNFVTASVIDTSAGAWRSGARPADGRSYNDPRYSSQGTRAYDDQRGYGQRSYDDREEFSERDRRIIRDCLTGGTSGLPPGLAKRDRLPPGLERQLQRNGTLPPGLQKRVQPLPGVCEGRLPRLPVDWRRVILGGRIILLGQANRILDMFWVNE